MQTLDVGGAASQSRD